MVEAAESLGQVRERIDALDDRIHDLIMERSALVESVIAAKSGRNAPAYRPGREAQILRRLIGRHHGRFPPLPLIRVWREIISASLGLQGRFAVAAYAGDDAGDFRDTAREHFGTATPVAVQRTFAGVVNAVTEGSAAVGILPFPDDRQDVPWWPRIAHATAPSIVARLPFAPPAARPNGGDAALVIAMMPPEPSGEDRSFVALRTGAASSRARINAAFAAQGFAPTMMLTQHDASDAETTLFLVEFEGFVEPDDDRIAAIADGLDGPAPGLWILGAYARPFTVKDLDQRSGRRP